MAGKKFGLGMLVMTFVLCGIVTSCWTTGKARDAIPRTAITLQRVREVTTFLGEVAEVFGLIDYTPDEILNAPMKIFVNDDVYELANGESKTITVINGSYVVYAVFGNKESKSIKFKADSKTIAVNVYLKRSAILQRTRLEIEVK
jgi:hypothetical protein